jgi:predicted SprT family Zn-dependent metalloprotease
MLYANVMENNDKFQYICTCGRQATASIKKQNCPKITYVCTNIEKIDDLCFDITQSNQLPKYN